MIYFLLKMLFAKNGFKKSLKKIGDEQLIELRDRAINEEEYELAAYLSYYIEFKRFKTDILV